MRDGRHRAGAILVIDDKVPEFDRHAGGLYTYQLLRLLEGLDFKVLYLPDDRFPRQPYLSSLQRTGIEVLVGDVDLGAWLAVNGPYLDHVIVGRPQVAPRYIEPLRRSTKARLTYYTHDLHFLRERRRYQSTGALDALRESERWKVVEQRVIRSADAVITPSTDELDAIRELAPGVAAHAVPPYVMPDQGIVASPLSERDSVIFVGGFAHDPNVDAALFLVGEIMPLVWREVPTVHLLLVGSHPPPVIRDLSSGSVTVTGYVPDIGPYYRLARLSVNPLRFGAGLKGKVLSSIEAGVPVITTEIGNEGIRLTDGVDGLIGNTAAEIAGHVVRMFREPGLAERFAAESERFVSDRFGIECVRRQLLSALGGAPSNGRSDRSPAPQLGRS